MNPVKLVIGFVPFLLFTIVSTWLPVSWAAIIGFVAAGAVCMVTARGGVKMLPVIQAILLLVIAVLGLTGAGLDDFLTRYARGGASLILGLIIVITARFAPFTAQFARAEVPQEYWRSPQFVATNQQLSTAWGLAVLAIGAGRIVASATHLSHPLQVVLGWGVPILALYLAFTYTKKIVAQHAPAASANAVHPA